MVDKITIILIYNHTNAFNLLNDVYSVYFMFKFGLYSCPSIV